jgi:CRP-like cAMP-binding protein
VLISLARFLLYVGSVHQLNGGLLIARRQPARFNPKSFLGTVGEGKTLLTFPKRQIIFSQGDAAYAVFYIQEGKVMLSVVSQQGKEAIVAILERAVFLGESCLARQTVRAAPPPSWKTTFSCALPNRR